MITGKLEQGFNNERYKVIVRSLIFIFHGNEVLLIKGDPHKKIWPNLYNGIGGHLEKGEDILTSARRELFEETGLANIALFLHGNILIDMELNQGILLFIYRGETPEKEIRKSLEGDLQWIAIEELDSLPLVSDIKTIIPKIIDKNGEYFSGFYQYVENKLEMRFLENS